MKSLQDILAEIKARTEAATPGPWRQCEYNTHAIEGLTCSGKYIVIPDRTKDAEFIAHAREDVPRLVEALERSLALSEIACKGILEPELEHLKLEIRAILAGASATILAGEKK